MTDGDALYWSACRNISGQYQDALSGGLYAPQVRWWFHHFAPRQLAVVSLGAYLSRPHDVLQQLAAFLEMDGQGAAQVSASRGTQPVARGTLPSRRKDEPCSPSLDAWLQHRLPAARPPESGARDSAAASSAPSPASAASAAAPPHLFRSKRRSTFTPVARSALQDFYRPHNADFFHLLMTASAKDEGM
eukprot:CAMPEP_0185168710 /NCGR_PEP_ID=MMETSP1139-20130426/16229_1 /TAXON_ID=298111 /ORGANISM="Pavlova sp., Strain CCMP459" /LENGTH=188 /DNA_ID=CAMNT_0027734227 /DNA_START=604 /DNA_END=1167 /DNA_ORIENTATION=+